MEKTFENFIIDKSNEFAYRASLEVANAPGNKFNPLVLYGSTSYGKTHLTHAIKHKVEDDFGMRVLMKECQDIFDEWVIQMKCARSEDKNPDLFAWFKGYDVIILENIQCLAWKHSTQEYFVDAVCRLADSGKQVVLTTAKALCHNSLETIFYRMNQKSDFWLLADILAPETETKQKFMADILKETDWKPKEELVDRIIYRCVNRSQMEAVVRELELIYALNDGELDELTICRVLRHRSL